MRILLPIFAVLFLDGCNHRDEKHLKPDPIAIQPGTAIELHTFGGSEVAMELQAWLVGRGYPVTTRASSEVARSTTDVRDNSLKTETWSTAAAYRLEVQHGTTGMDYHLTRLQDGVLLEFYRVQDTSSPQPPSYWIAKAKALMAADFAKR